MKALVFSGPETIEVGTVPDPQIEDPSDAIVAVSRTAICGSDLHIYHGRETGLDIGTAMGHEFVGDIVEVGANVRNFQKGDSVLSPFTVSCGDCVSCRDQLTSRCDESQIYGWVENGHGLQGGQAEFVRVPFADSTLVAIPEDINLAEAILLGDNLATGFFCADLAEVRPGGTYVVLGCGAVGLIAVMAAFERGADKVIAVDHVDYRRESAAGLGATSAIPDDSLPQFIAEQTGGIGVDAVLEAVGSPAAQNLSYQLVKPGGIIATVGVHTTSNFAFSPVDAYDKNLTYKTGRCPVRAYVDRLIPFVRERRFDLAGTIFSHELPLAEGVSGYKTFDQKLDHCTKILLRVD